VNLVSAKKLCKGGLKGSFDEENIWITQGKKKVLHATQLQGLYIVKHISKTLKDHVIKAQPEAWGRAMPVTTEATREPTIEIDMKIS
jgi:hypothetical protein